MLKLFVLSVVLVPLYLPILLARGNAPRKAMQGMIGGLFAFNFFYFLMLLYVIAPRILAAIGG